MGVDRDQVRRVAGIGLDEVGQSGVGDDDVVVADGMDLVVGDEGARAESGTVDDHRQAVGDVVERRDRLNLDRSASGDQPASEVGEAGGNVHERGGAVDAVSVTGW